MKDPLHWSERRVARFATLVVSGAVVIATVILFVQFVRSAPGLPGGWQTYWYVPSGIVAVFAFALLRFLAQLRLFRTNQ